jgi:hypothetical protein
MSLIHGYSFSSSFYLVDGGEEEDVVLWLFCVRMKWSKSKDEEIR